MFVSFIGSPGSGKTTIAALVFAQLKKDGVNTEFIPEQARRFIAERKYGLLDGAEVRLNEGDQMDILKMQDNLEEIFTATLPNETVIVADSSIINTLFYLPNKKDDRVDYFLRKAQPRYHNQNSLVYLAEPLPQVTSDPLRLHSMEESRAINRRMIDELGSDNLTFGLNIRHLNGPIAYRVSTVISDIYSQFSKM